MSRYKTPIFLGLIIFIIGAFILYLEDQMRNIDYNAPCPFCQESVLERQKFYENEQVVAMISYRPTLEGHCIIIPKRHVQRFEDLTDEETIHIAQAVKKVHQAVSKVYGTSAYLLLQKNGKEVGQSVSHLHIHYIPRKENDFTVLSFLAKIYLSPLIRITPEDKQKEQAEKLRMTLMASDQL